MVDVLCTTAGGIEEDLIKCLAPTYLGDFHAVKGEAEATSCELAAGILLE